MIGREEVQALIDGLREAGPFQVIRVYTVAAPGSGWTAKHAEVCLSKDGRVQVVPTAGITGHPQYSQRRALKDGRRIANLLGRLFLPGVERDPNWERLLVLARNVYAVHGVWYVAQSREEALQRYADEVLAPRLTGQMGPGRTVTGRFHAVPLADTSRDRFSAPPVLHHADLSAMEQRLLRSFERRKKS